MPSQDPNAPGRSSAHRQKHATHTDHAPGRKRALRSQLELPADRKPPFVSQHGRPTDGGSVGQLAAEVIRGSNRDHPADAVLRVLLRRFGLSPADRRKVSLLVFSYYRWHGWLKNEKTVEHRLARAQEFADRFTRNPFTLPMEQLRAKAVPGWVLDEVAAEDEWLRSLQREPLLWLRARPGQGRSLAKRLGSARSLSSKGLSETILYEGKADLFASEDFESGAFEIQDISSQLVGLICGAKPGETWWDACAGEGGKTLHLSDLMENRGLIWASDRAAWRLERLRVRAARARVFNFRVASWDGGTGLPTRTGFDGVLVDAPCSGIGTWQRNPHARWTATLSDVSELAGIQKRLLASASAGVKPGGKLIYAVCSLARSETEAVVKDFQDRFSEFEPQPVKDPLNPDLPGAAGLWLWPQSTRGNGMFVFVWRRRV
jgi:16S rRNA (cytosine967-C5)-methyltransferase